MPKDDNNVVKLRQPRADKPAAGVAVSDAITPKSILNMTEVEQELFLNQLRDRRMKAAETLRQAKRAKQHADSIAVTIKLERKSSQAEKQLEKTTKALERLESLIYDLRALHMQYTDVDITKEQ
jgi:hypothetical protein